MRASFLAARDGNDVEEIINALLTQDERMKIGRRIQIAEKIVEGIPYKEISDELQVGLTTVLLVARKLDQNPLGYKLIMDREDKVEKEYRQKAREKIGGSKMIFKKNAYTGFKRKDVRR